MVTVIDEQYLQYGPQKAIISIIDLYDRNRKWRSKGKGISINNTTKIPGHHDGLRGFIGFIA